MDALVLMALASFGVLGGVANAQGILTVTPGRTISISAGTGALGYAGDGGAASSATLASPSAVVYDAGGNLYVADARNNVVREVLAADGAIRTIAGAGVEGYGGDHGPAAAALLDTPTGVAVDASGNVYIADSHNQRIRKVSGGTITTIAGTGVAGFSGDNAAATAAQLSLPTAVAVDASGNVYIADTNNQRVREVAGATISTIAGNGAEMFAGDGGAATSASLDSPTGVAVDAGGNVYIADRHNQRIRKIANGTITTLAGSGAASFSGGFAGDGASATAAALAKPSGVSVDASGNVYIADTGNQRIRQVGGGAIATVVGSGRQGFGGDGTSPASANLDSPRSVAPDSTGNLAIADTLNERTRTGALPTLSFVSQSVGATSAAQAVTLANSGTSPIAVSAISFNGAFGAIGGGTCGTAPVTLAAGASCIESIAYVPEASGAAAGSVVFSGAGIVPQTILLAGSATPAATATTLSSSNATPFIGQNVTFAATVTPGAGSTGSVSFYNGAALIGTAQPLASGVASIAATFATAGAYAITAVYSGDANYLASTSPTLTQLVGDFNFTLTPDPSNPAQGANYSITVLPGGAGVYNFVVQPLNGPFTFPITLSATGLPPGATATFNPQTLTLGPNAQSFSMTIQTAKASGALRGTGLGGAAFAALLLPLAGGLRRRGKKLRSIVLGLLFAASLAAVGGLAGCGGGNGFLGQPARTYTIQIAATAQGASGGTLRHFASVKLVVE